ncbi:MAG: metal ABC transporter permease [Actinobacteria bacterium]|nr:metal ABC transporter permease [Actinomycetota bacterium]
MLLGITAGAVGVFAVLRQRSLVGDALSHAALPGVCIAFIATGAKDATTLLAGAAIAGFVGALLMVGIERTGRIRPDAAIGVVLSSFFSLGIVLLTYIASTDNSNQAGLESYLFGQAAGLLERDVVVTGAIGIGALALVALGFRAIKTTLFDTGFAGSAGLPVRALELGMTALLVAAVVVGIRMVGAILMVAMLVVPAVAARQLTDRLAVLLPLAGLIGAAVGVTGALLSARAELPTGPVIVLVAISCVIVCVLGAAGVSAVARATARTRSPPHPRRGRARRPRDRRPRRAAADRRRAGAGQRPTGAGAAPRAARSRSRRDDPARRRAPVPLRARCRCRPRGARAPRAVGGVARTWLAAQRGGRPRARSDRPAREPRRRVRRQAARADADGGG